MSFSYDKIIFFLHLLKIIILKIPVIRNLFFKLDNFRYNNYHLKRDFTYDINKKIEYNHKIYTNIEKKIKNLDVEFNFKNKIIMEIGPGHTLLLAIIFIINGAKKVYLLDKYKQIFDDPLNLILYNQYLKIYPRNSDKNKLTYDKIKKKIIYLGNTSIEKFILTDKLKFDFIFSNAVLEHVPNLDLAIRKIYLLLKKNGYTFHQIDLRDHFHIRDKCYLDFLKYTQKYWKLFGDTNRYRFFEYISLFKKNNYKILEINYKRVKNSLQLGTIKNQLNKEFQNLPDFDLSIIGFNILAKK